MEDRVSLSSIFDPRSSILDLLTRRLFEAPDRVDVGGGSHETCFHGVDGQMSRSEFFPLGDLLDPRLGRSLANGKSSFNADAHGIPLPPRTNEPFRSLPGTFRQASAAETSRRRAGPDGAMHDRQCLRTRLE